MAHDILELLPDAGQAERLAVLHAAAFEPPAQWGSRDFLRDAELASRIILVDRALKAGLLVLQVGADEAEILTLAVAPDARRQGVAKALLRAGIASLRQHDVQRVFLEVAEDNAAAIQLYDSLDFAQIGRRKQYYRRMNNDRIDALVLSLALQ